MACDRSPGKGEGRGWRPLIRGCHRKVTGGVLSDFFQTKVIHRTDVKQVK